MASRSKERFERLLAESWSCWTSKRRVSKPKSFSLKALQLAYMCRDANKGGTDQENIE